MSLRPRAVAAPGTGLRRQLEVRARLVAAARRVNWGLLAITLVGSLLGAYYTVKIRQWTVMSDELQYQRLAQSIGDTLSPIPNIRGAYTGSLAQLYPILMAPFIHFFAMPTAFRALHVENAVLMASTAIPAYLLTREVVSSKLAPYLVAALTISVPWMVMSTMMLTEVAAYPAFVWAILALQRSLAKPSPTRDLLALGGLLLAFLARTQFLILVPVFAATLILHESGWWLTQGRRPLPALRDGAVLAVRQHPVLAWSAAGGAGVALLAALGGRLDDLLGRYATTVHGGNLLPHGILSATAKHIDFVAVGIGVLPFVLAAAWAFSVLIRPSGKPGHAFAVLSIVTVTAIAFETTSFNLRFAAGGPIQDRYLFYLVPLFFVGMVACLLDERRRSIAVLAVGGVFAWLASITAYGPSALLFFASPDTVWHHVLQGRAWQLGNLIGIGLTATKVIVAGTIVLSIALAYALKRLPRSATFAAVGISVFAYCFVETAYVFHKVVPSVNNGAPTTLAGRDWIDEAVPAGTKVGAVVAPINANWDGAPRTWGPGGTEAVWQDAEFWNKSIDRVYLYGGYGGYAPFKNLTLAIDYPTGKVTMPEPRSVIVMSASDVRFGLAANWSKVYATGMMLLRPARPYHAIWVARDIQADGWTVGGVPAHIRLYPAAGGHAVRRRVAIIFQSEGEVKKARKVRAAIGSAHYVSTLGRGKQRIAVLNVCVPPNRPVDGTMSASTPTRHGPQVGFRITRIRVSGSGARCAPS
jgi:hypothetical protein